MYIPTSSQLAFGSMVSVIREKVGEGRRWGRRGGGGGEEVGRGGGGRGEEGEVGRRWKGEEVERGGGGRGKEVGEGKRWRRGRGRGETVSCSTHPRVLTTSKQCHMITKGRCSLIA